MGGGGLLLTFSKTVSQNGTSSHLLALHSSAWARVGAWRPWRPGAEDAVCGTGHLAGHGLRIGGTLAELMVHHVTYGNIVRQDSRILVGLWAGPLSETLKSPGPGALHTGWGLHYAPQACCHLQMHVMERKMGWVNRRIPVYLYLNLCKWHINDAL